MRSFLHLNFSLFYIPPSILIFSKVCKTVTKIVLPYPCIFSDLLLHVQLLRSYRTDHLKYNVIYFWLENVSYSSVLQDFLTRILKKSVGFVSKSFIRLLMRYPMLLIYKINFHYKNLWTVLIKNNSLFLAIKILKMFWLLKHLKCFVD